MQRKALNHRTCQKYSQKVVFNPFRDDAAYCFLIIPKTATKMLLNIFSNVGLLLVFFSKHIAKALSIHEKTDVLIASFFIYAALRGVCWMVSIGSLRAEDCDKTKERKSNK